MSAVLRNTNTHGTAHAAAESAKEASRALATAAPRLKAQALEQIAAALERDAEHILAANVADVEAAEAEGALSKALMSRLRLDRAKIVMMAEQVRAVAALDDPGAAIGTRPRNVASTNRNIPSATPPNPNTVN